jgi:F-box interacting protein
VRALQVDLLLQVRLHALARSLLPPRPHRKKLPCSLAGFFHQGYNKNRFPSSARYFTNVTGKGDPLVDPSLSFLPGYSSLDILDCCNGLLLCRCWKATDPKTMDYVVCNPATEKWVVVPATEWSSEVNVARLVFEPSVSSHFHVFEFIDEETWGLEESKQSNYIGRIQEMAIYSSKAGVWRHESMDGYEFAIPKNWTSVFLNGILHLSLSISDDMMLVIDVEGNDWWVIDNHMLKYNEDDASGAIFLSQRQLYATETKDDSELSVWALEDLKTEDWTLKHNVSHLELFGARYSSYANHFSVISFHPERNMIFLVCGPENTLMSYEMDCKRMTFICQLGRDCQVQHGMTRYIPYVPLFSESLADGQQLSCLPSTASDDIGVARAFTIMKL